MAQDGIGSFYLVELMAGLERAGLNSKGALRVILEEFSGLLIAKAGLNGSPAPAVHNDLLPLLQLLGCLTAKIWVRLCTQEQLELAAAPSLYCYCCSGSPWQPPRS